MKCLICYVLFIITVTCEKTNDVTIDGSLKVDGFNNKADLEVINKLLEIIRHVRMSLKPESERPVRRNNAETFNHIIKYGLKTILKLSDDELKTVPAILKEELGRQFELNQSKIKDDEDFDLRDMLERLSRKFEDDHFNANERTILTFFSNMYKPQYGNTIMQCIRKLRMRSRHPDEHKDTLKVIIRDLVHVFKNNFYMNTCVEVQTPLAELIKKYAERNGGEAEKKPSVRSSKRQSEKQRKRHKTRQRASGDDNRRETATTAKREVQTIWYEEIGKVHQEKRAKKRRRKQLKSESVKRSYKKLDLFAPRRFRIKNNVVNMSSLLDVGHIDATNKSLLTPTFVRNKDVKVNFTANKDGNVQTRGKMKAYDPRKNITLDYVLKKTSELQQSIQNLTEFVKDNREQLRCVGRVCPPPIIDSSSYEGQETMDQDSADIIGRKRTRKDSSRESTNSNEST